MSKHENKEAVLTVRVRPSVKARLEKLADAHTRSVANYLDWLVMQQPLPEERGKRG